MTPEIWLVAIAVTIRVLITTAIVALCAWYIIQIRPLPYIKAFVIATTAHLLAKAAYTLLNWPIEIAAAIPGIVLLVLTLGLFDANVWSILAAWLVGFGSYLSIHELLIVLFDVSVLFAVWAPA